jgi:hypothetical protein
MQSTLFALMALTLVITLLRAFRTEQPRTASEYFSFGSAAKPSQLMKSFFVTNASFATAFVSLFLISYQQGILSIWTPIGFFIGAIFFVYILLPRMMSLFWTGRRYIVLLGEAANSKYITLFVALYVVISLWLFTYTEIQGFVSLANVSDKTNAIFSPLALFMGISICIVMGIYCFRSGLRGVIASDNFQFWSIIAGSTAVHMMSALLIVLIMLGEVGSFSWPKTPDMITILVAVVEGIAASCFRRCSTTIIGREFRPILLKDLRRNR